LTLPVGAFVFDVVTALARIDPEVDRPREKLNKLAGCVGPARRRAALHRLALVKGVGSEALRVNTRKACHLSLANLIIGKTMSVYEAQQTINHFCQAEAFDRAGALFLYLLDDGRSLEAGKDVASLRDVGESPCPKHGPKRQAPSTRASTRRLAEIQPQH